MKIKTLREATTSHAYLCMSLGLKYNYIFINLFNNLFSPLSFKYLLTECLVCMSLDTARFHYCIK